MSIDAGVALPLIAEIGPPAFSTLSFGPLTIHLYALALISGAWLGVFLVQRLAHVRKILPDDILTLALWALPLSLVGARIYHVLTSWDTYFGPGGQPLNSFAIWNGGLGVWGGMLAGIVVAFYFARQHSYSTLNLLDVIAPGMLLAQAVGRWGNYFNQELFGGPTSLPWGLRISSSSNFYPHSFPEGTLFHPTFLYESLWCLAGAAILMWLVLTQKNLKFGLIASLYGAYYCTGRLFIEKLRIDDAPIFWGQRVNVWTCLIGVVFSVVCAAWIYTKHQKKRSVKSQ